MKKILLFVFAILANFSLSAQLIISGVIDGPLTGGTPKAIELYVVSDIPDLSIYGIGSANNGGGTDGQEFSFPTIPVTAGEFIYVASESPQFTNFFGFAPDFTDGVANINGDDAIELFKNGVVIDLFGNPNMSGTGQPWEYLDGWARRTGFLPNTDPNFFDTAPVSGWIFSGPNALDGETSNATAATPFPANTPLPIELTYFTAKATANNQVALEWRTESELNNDYMAIERSQDGQKFFEIGKVKGAGTTVEAQVYNFVDAAPKAGVNYYRLRQVDFDGGVEYHKIVAVTLGGDTKVTVYPTLVNNELNVSVVGTATVQITNLLGQIVKTAMVSDFATLNVADLDNGTYFLILEMGTSKELVRFVKQ